MKSQVFVIAEIGSVHDGSMGNAMCLVDAAAAAGADAVKFQTHIAEAETLADAPPPPFFAAEPRAEYFRRTGFTAEQWEALKSHCESRNVEFMSSPFSEEAVDLLEAIGMRRFKIPSGEVTNLPLLRKIAKLRKPVLLSSGMSSWGELDRAVEEFRGLDAGLTMLQCTTEYPCPPERVGLNIMLEMRQRYGVAVGLSDHTLTRAASLAAVALGAKVIERHLTFSRRMYGSDAKHSLEPDEFSALVSEIRAVETMLASPVDKDDLQRLSGMRSVFQKSVVTLMPITEGTVIARDMLGLRKPGTGLAPERIDDIVGRRAVRDLPAGLLLTTEDFS